MSQGILHVKDLEFSYGRVKILKKLNMEIQEGRFVSIIGPNGSGKTTFLKLLAGITKPAHGRVLYKGMDIETFTARQAAREFSFIFQHNHSRFPFTCLEMVMLGRHPHKSRLQGYSAKDLDFVSKVMKRTQTLDYADKMVNEISGGELQRVIIARALAQQPKVLFMDEAFSELDICAKMHCIRLLKNMIKEEGLSVISIMHDINTAYSFSDDVIALKDGRLVGNGHPHQVMTKKFIRDVFDIDVEMIENKGFFIV